VRSGAEFVANEAFMSLLVMVSFPRDESILEIVVNDANSMWEKWFARFPEFKFNPAKRYEDIVVQTNYTVSVTTFLYLLVKTKTNVPVMGGTGTGKSVVVNDFLHIRAIQDHSLSFQLNFSAETTAKETQKVLESWLTHRRSNLIGPPMGKQGMVFVDDMNTPTPDQYFAQPPIAQLRQYIDQHGMYDRKKHNFIHLTDTLFLAACGSPGGGPNVMRKRLTQRFNIIAMSLVGQVAMTAIFCAISSVFFTTQKSAYSKAVQELGLPVVKSMVDLYSRVSANDDF
jgi:dynein heavy chain